MTGKDLLDSLRFVDDDLIEEAGLEQLKEDKQKKSGNYPDNQQQIIGSHQSFGVGDISHETQICRDQYNAGRLIKLRPLLWRIKAEKSQ